MGRIMILTFLLIAIAFILLADHFDKKKTAEYKNDERWQAVKLKANNVILKFLT